MTPTVTQWTDITMEFIKEASAYAASGVDDPDMSAMIRHLRVVTASFMAALQSVGR
jgi:uncharacterized membrane-anchored protein